MMSAIHAGAPQVAGAGRAGPDSTAASTSVSASGTSVNGSGYGSIVASQPTDGAPMDAGGSVPGARATPSSAIPAPAKVDAREAADVASRELAASFNTIDIDRNGYISYEEFKEAIQKNQLLVQNFLQPAHDSLKMKNSGSFSNAASK